MKSPIVPGLIAPFPVLFAALSYGSSQASNLETSATMIARCIGFSPQCAESVIQQRNQATK